MLNPFRKSLKVIRYNISGTNNPDDPSYPYKIEISRQHPEFHRLARIIRYGSDEYLAMRATSLRAIHQYINANRLRTDELLNICIITGPSGEIERFGNGVE